MLSFYWIRGMMCMELFVGHRLIIVKESLILKVYPIFIYIMQI